MKQISEFTCNRFYQIILSNNINIILTDHDNSKGTPLKHTFMLISVMHKIYLWEITNTSCTGDPRTSPASGTLSSRTHGFKASALVLPKCFVHLDYLNVNVWKLTTYNKHLASKRSAEVFVLQTLPLVFMLSSFQIHFGTFCDKDLITHYNKNPL